MPKETVALTEREIKILNIFVKDRELDDLEIANELAVLIRKLRS